MPLGFGGEGTGDSVVAASWSIITVFSATLEACPRLSGPLHNQEHKEMQKSNNDNEISGF